MSSKQYTQSITSFNGLNQTDNVNSSYIIMGENMDSKHYPYLAPRDLKFTGVTRTWSANKDTAFLEMSSDTVNAVKTIDAMFIRGKLARVIYFDNFKVADWNSQGIIASSEETEQVEFLEYDGKIIPYPMQPANIGIVRKCFVNMGTNIIVNMQLRIQPYGVDAGIYTMDRRSYWISGGFTTSTSGNTTTISLNSTTFNNNYEGFNRFRYLYFSFYSDTKQTVFGKPNNRINFTYAYENLTPKSDAETLARVDKYGYFRIPEDVTYTTRKRILLTYSTHIEQTDINLSDFKTDSTYSNYCIPIGLFGDLNIGDYSFTYINLNLGLIEYDDEYNILNTTEPQNENTISSFIRINPTSNIKYKTDDLRTYMWCQPRVSSLTSATNYFTSKEYGIDTFKAGELVCIQETNGSNTYNRGTFLLTKVENGSFSFPSDRVSFSTSSTYRIDKYIHKAEYVCGHKNRLYAYSNNLVDKYDMGNETWKYQMSSKTIYISALGLPNVFENFDTNIDSYAVADSDSSDCVDIVEYNDMVILFKEHAIEKIIGDLPSNYQTYVYDWCGPLKGFKTVTKINEKLYYLGSDFNVYVFNGGEPQVISRQLNELVPKYNIVNIGLDGKCAENTMIVRPLLSGKTFTTGNTGTTHAYGFTYDGDYYLSVQLKVFQYWSSYATASFITKTFKYDTYLNQWFPYNCNLYKMFDSNEEGQYMFIRNSDDKLYTVDVVNGITGPLLGKDFNAILSPTNLGTMRLKNIRRMRLRVEQYADAVYDGSAIVVKDNHGTKLNIGYAIDNNPILHCQELELNDNSVIEIPIEKVGSEITIAIEGNGIIIIKGIEIDYEIMENI